MKRTILALRTVLAGATVVIMTGSTVMPAMAQSTTSPCAADRKEFCGSETAGGGRLLKCYEANKDKVSPGCRAWAERAKSNAAVVKAACQKTLDARCNFEKGDPLETVDCLQSNYIELTVECRERLNVFKGMYPKPVN